MRNFPHLLRSISALRYAGEALEPGIARAARGPQSPVDMGAKRRRIYRRFYADFKPRFGRFRTEAVPLSLPAWRGLEALLPPVTHRPWKFLPCCLSD